jgi:hypothetical protein
VTTETPIDPRRKWTAITLATLLMVVSYVAILIGFIAIEVEDGPAPGPVIAFGLGLVPFVFIILAFMSGNRRAPGAVMKAMALSVIVAGPLSALMADAVSGLVAGFGIGGAVTLRREENHTLKARLIAVGITTVYVAVLVNFSVEGGLFAGGVLPFLSIGIADWVMDRRADDSAARTRAIEDT